MGKALSPAKCKIFAKRFLEYKDQLEELLRQIEEDVGRLPRVMRQRAERYWLGHMQGAIGDGENGSMFTMQDTIDELDSYEEGQEIEE